LNFVPEFIPIPLKKRNLFLNKNIGLNDRIYFKMNDSFTSSKCERRLEPIFFFISAQFYWITMEYGGIRFFFKKDIDINFN
jgi:hypothetical protein